MNVNPHDSIGFQWRTLLRGTWDLRSDLPQLDSYMLLLVQLVNAIGFELQRRGIDPRRFHTPPFPDFSYIVAQSAESVTVVLGHAQQPSMRLAYYDFLPEPKFESHLGVSDGWDHLLFAHFPDDMLALPEQERLRRIEAQAEYLVDDVTTILRTTQSVNERPVDPQSLRVFVSHHHSEEEDKFTSRLVVELEAAGADVWVDNQRITSDDFIKKISEGLAERQWLVLVMTPQSVASPWVQREVNVALNEATAGRMLGVIPIVATPTPEQDIPMLWRPLHRWDATRAYEPARDGLFRAMSLSVRVSSHPGTIYYPVTPDELHRKLVLQSLLRDAEHDRDALSNFLYHAELGDESEHVISQAAGLDIWYDDVLATRELPQLLAGREANDIHQLRHSFPRERDIDALLSKLLQQYERFPRLQEALHEELTQGEGSQLWQDYLAWEEADKRRSLDPERLWNERVNLAHHWESFKSTSQIAQKRVTCRRAFVEAREQCEVIMGMVMEELNLLDSDG